MIEPILEASPSFKPMWAEFLAEWQADAEELPIYLALSDLARHISQLLQQGAVLELKQIFQVVEQWHLAGDPYVKEAATVGLLEDFQNTNVVGEGTPEQLEAFLGPESRHWWHRVDQFWTEGKLLCDD